MTMYYCETTMGCTLRTGEDMDAVEEGLIREIGERHYQSIREATPDDIAWVRGMGGHVPI